MNYNDNEELLALSKQLVQKENADNVEQTISRALNQAYQAGLDENNEQEVNKRFHRRLQKAEGGIEQLHRVIKACQKEIEFYKKLFTES